MDKAKDLEAKLMTEGRHMDAEVIRGLRISARSAHTTLKVIHRDNMELRQKLGLPSFLDETGGR